MFDDQSSFQKNMRPLLITTTWLRLVVFFVDSTDQQTLGFDFIILKILRWLPANTMDFMREKCPECLQRFPVEKAGLFLNGTKLKGSK